MQKINFENLPSTNTPINASNLNQIQTNVENAINNVENIELLAVTDTAPSECSEGDKYFNIDTKLIYEATATDTWGSTGTTPISDIFYIVLSEQKIYTYNGTTLVSVGSGAGGTSNVYSTSTVEGYSANYVNNHSLTVSEAEPTDKTKMWVQATGNLVDASTVNIFSALLRSSGDLYTSSSERTLYIPCKPNTTYKITKTAGSRFRVDERATTPTINSSNVNFVQQDTASMIIYKTSANGNYLLVNYFGSGDTATADTLLNSIVITVVPSINVLENNNYNEIYTKDIYSTTEVKTNKVWVNNKPIYRKCASIDNYGTLQQDATIPFPISNIDEIIWFNLRYYYASGSQYFNMPLVESSGNTLTCNYDKANGYFKCAGKGSWSGSGRPLAIIVEYTKTTD